MLAQDVPSQSSFLGVSLAGAEFGVEAESFSNQNPGVADSEYVWNSPHTLRYFAKTGLRLVRLPFRWERIQPKLQQPLDKQHLRDLRSFCAHAKAAGVRVILDVHNYGRYRSVYNGKPRTSIIDEVVDGKTLVDREDFADLWTRLAVSFSKEKSVVGYGLMNEPHDMGSSNWKEISQAAVDAIRKVDTRTRIVVAGDDWSSAERFRLANGSKAWIKDPANRVIYEAHCYFDNDGSGKYTRSFQQEKTADPRMRERGLKRLKPFADWCEANEVRGMIGEFGVPRDPAWREMTELFVAECVSQKIPACYWAAGEWWGDYSLSIQPNDDQRDAPQIKWLKAAAKN